MALNKNKLQESLDYIKKEYNISSLLKEWGCPTNKKTIACPLHSDITPSCAIDIENNRYHCFSCGSYGSYMNFLHEYQTKVKGEKKAFTTRVEEILKADNAMQSALGFNTIYDEELNHLTVEELIEFNHKPYTPHYISNKKLMKTLNHIKKNNDINDILDFFACVEKSYPDEMLYDKFVLKKNIMDITTLNEIKQYGDELAYLLDDEEGNSSDMNVERAIDILTSEFE